MKAYLKALLVVLILSGCTGAPETLTEIKSISKDAYLYGFPLIVNYRSMYAYSIDENSPDYKGPFNEPGCEARLFTPEDKGVVTPNSDTPYCMGVIDISGEPVVVSVPAVSRDRYYSLQLIDMYTHNFAYIGSLSTGTESGNYMITGPGWTGDEPEGVDSVFRCESDYFLVIIRTQLFGPDDLENVENLQSQYQFQPLSSFSGSPAPNQTTSPRWPEWHEGDQVTPAGFRYLDFVLSLLPVNSQDGEIRERMSKLNIGEGKFDLSAFNEEEQAAMQEGIDEARAEIDNMIKRTASDPQASGKMFGTRDYLTRSAREHYAMDNPWLIRTVAAQQGLYGNSKSEAIYPFYAVDEDNEILDGSAHDYVMVIENGALPPTSAFWSLTMYDGKTQFLVDNPIDRYLLNSTMADSFVFNEDGSLTFYIQKDPPDSSRMSNWLPAPDGPFYCVMRLYGPEERAQTGEWERPLISEVSSGTKRTE